MKTNNGCYLRPNYHSLMCSGLWACAGCDASLLTLTHSSRTCIIVESRRTLHSFERSEWRGRKKIIIVLPSEVKPRDFLSLNHDNSSKSLFFIPTNKIKMDQGDRFERPDKNGRTALHHAAMNVAVTLGQLERVCYMNKRSRRYKDAFGKLPVHYAVELGPKANPEIVEFLLIHYPESASFLLEYKRSLLHVAIKSGCSIEIMEMLLHAYPQACLCATENTNQVPLHYCILFRAPYDVFRLVCNCCPEAISAKDYAGRMPLHVAARNHCAGNIISFLMKRLPASVQAEDKYGNTPLSIACEHGALLPILRSIYEAWPFAIHKSDFEGRTPLHKSCATGKVQSVLFLLHVGANTDLTDYGGKKPFHLIPEPRVGIPKARCINDSAVRITKILSGQRKVWRPDTHMHYPPHYRVSVETLIMIMKRLTAAAQVKNGDKDLNIPWARIVKYLPRTWFDTESIMHLQAQLQPHLFVDRLEAKANALKKSLQAKVEADKNDIFAKRYKLNSIRKKLKQFSIQINKAAVKKAIRRVTTVIYGGTDTSQTDAIIEQIKIEREEKEAILRRAKRGIKARKLALKQKLISRGLRIMENDENPLDLMEKNELGIDWYEYLKPGYGVDEMFYNQLLRDDTRLHKDILIDIEEVPSYQDEEADAQNSLRIAEDLLQNEADDLVEGMTHVLAAEEIAYENWRSELEFLALLKKEEKVREDVQLRRRRDKSWGNMMSSKPFRPKTATSMCTESSGDGWSFATDDIVSIGSSMADGLSNEELIFFQRLECELRGLDDDLEYEIAQVDEPELWESNDPVRLRKK